MYKNDVEIVISNPERVSSRFPNITVYEPSVFECGEKGVMARYMRAISLAKKEISIDMKELYGRNILFAENETTDMRMAIKNLKEKVGRLRDVAKLFDSYIGGHVLLFRNKGEKRVPVEFDRIVRAVEAIRDKKSKRIVQEILFLD